MRDDVRHLKPAEVRRIALSSVPAALAGLALGDLVERRLGRPGVTAALMAISAAALYVVDRQAEVGRPSPATRSDHCPDPLRSAQPGGQRSPGGAATAAASWAQVAALAPGVSRTSATLTALRARGVGREEALRTSLLMSLPVTLGAAGLTAVRGRTAPPLVPTAVAGLTAYAAARRVRATDRLVAGSVIYRLAVATAVVAKLRRERR